MKTDVTMKRFKIEFYRPGCVQTIQETWEGKSKESVLTAADYRAFDFGLEIISISEVAS